MAEQPSRAPDIARLVADHWRRAALDWGSLRMEARLSAHALCCVLAALDGETDPDMLGIEAGSETARNINALVMSSASQMLRSEQVTHPDRKGSSRAPGGDQP